MKQKDKIMRRRIGWGIFWIFSAVLFINNSTQLLNIWFDLTYGQVNTIAWIGVLGSLFYLFWKIVGGEI